MILTIILMFLDILTTWYMSSNGATELNPLGKNITIFLIIKIFVLIGFTIFGILYKKWQIKSKLATVFIIIANIIYGIALINNFTNMIIFWYK